MWAELAHATISVALLAALVTGIYLLFTDLPVEPFLFGVLLGMPVGIAILTFTSPRRDR
jgi:hypothetical protein